MKQNGCNAYGAICRLEQGDTASFSFHGKDLPERDTKRQAASPIEIRRIQPLQNPALMRYLQERGISPGTAAPYVQEMYYRIGGKPYFALAFRNDSGGYGLRTQRYLFRVRGLYGLSFIPHYPATEKPGYALYRLAGLRYPELHRQRG